VSAPTNPGAGITAFQVDGQPGHTQGAIWGGGNAPPVDAAGNVYVATGNGSGATSDPDFGDSVVKLTALASPLDWWAPTNWQTLDSTDADLGSSMPTLLPGSFLFQSGKDSSGYLLNGADLGHVSPPVAQASGFCSGGSFGGAVYDPGNSAIYASCNSGTDAVDYGQGRLLGASGRNRASDDRRRPGVGDQPLDGHTFRARPDVRLDAKSLLDPGEHDPGRV
jgi:hypothetical protein